MNLFINQPVKTLSFHRGERVSDAWVLVLPLSSAILKDHYSFPLLLGCSGSLPLGFRTCGEEIMAEFSGVLPPGKDYIPLLIIIITCAWEAVVCTVMVSGQCHSSKG